MATILQTQSVVPVASTTPLTDSEGVLPTRGHGPCIGVDGAGSGWIAVWLERGVLRYAVHESAASLIDRHRSAPVVAVDIPMGLTEQGRREADVQARRFVGGRRACSIFPAPVRGILQATSQREASSLHRLIDQRGFGAQAFAILAKVREWDDLLRLDVSARAAVREVHPEVSFAALNGGVGLAEGKKTEDGAAKRAQLLSTVFGAKRVSALRAAVPHALAAPDDVLDALAALWSAGRIARREAGVLPDPFPHDSSGLPMAIWY